MTSHDLLVALAKRYPTERGEYAFLANVRNGVGFVKATRTADAMAISLWPSRGLMVEGFEIKVNRGDWKRELEEPAKADALARYCDKWWIVAPPTIVLRSELPPTWGLLEWSGKKWRQFYAVRHLEPIPLDRLMVASIMRSFSSGMVPEGCVEELVSARLEESIKGKTESLQRELNKCRRVLAEVERFEVASGIRVRDTWNGGSLGDAVRSVMKGEHRLVPSYLEDLLDSTDRLRRHLIHMVELSKNDAVDITKEVK